MNISARNLLKGPVKRVEIGAVNAEVLVELSGGFEIVSIITKASAERLELAPGKKFTRSERDVLIKRIKSNTTALDL